jgi:hypothetical protein
MAAKDSFDVETDESFIPRWQGNANGIANATAVGTHL